MPPQQLEASGWVQKVAGRVVAPSSNTFFPKASDADTIGAGSKLDYFVITASMSSLVKAVDTVDTSQIAQHTPVRLTMSLATPKPTMRVLCKWYTPGPYATYGPTRPLPSWDSFSAEGQGRRQAPEDLDQYYRAFVEALEEEVIARVDMTESQLNKFRGRAEGPRFIRTPAIQPVAYGYPRASELARDLRRLQSRLGALASNITAEARQQGTVCYARCRMIANLRHRIACTGGRMRAMKEWETLSQRLRGIRACSAEDLRATAEQVGAIAHDQELSSSRSRLRQWKQWLRTAVSGGAKAAHAWTRGPHGWSGSEKGPSQPPEPQPRDHQHSTHPPLAPQPTPCSRSPLPATHSTISPHRAEPSEPDPPHLTPTQPTAIDASPPRHPSDGVGQLGRYEAPLTPRRVRPSLLASAEEALEVTDSVQRAESPHTWEAMPTFGHQAAELGDAPPSPPLYHYRSGGPLHPLGPARRPGNRRPHLARMDENLGRRARRPCTAGLLAGGQQHAAHHGGPASASCRVH